MSFLASDVFVGARAFLNDQNANLYSNTSLLPHLITANEELEQQLLILGSPVERVLSAVIPITAGITSISIGGSAALPTDFLMPLSLHERTQGDSAQSWTEMTPQDYEPENQIPTTSFKYYAFRNNAIYFPAATTNRDILLKYNRQLAVISGPNSPEDFYLAKRFLCARLAELGARYIGMNDAFADKIYLREVKPRKDDLDSIFTLQGQTVRARRPRFTTKRSTTTR